MKINREKVEQLVRTMKPLFTDSSRASQIKTKGACDYVTQVDIQVQKLIKEGLYQMYPQVQFMGEEQDNTAIDRKGDFWILDPVDGTTNLIHDFRHSTLSLAYAEEGTVELGIVYQPYTDEMFVAVKGKGAFLNGKPIHVSEAKTLSESLVTIGTSPYYHELADWIFKVFKEVFLSCQDIR
ncbi:MAG: inositol monophosphatase family protein, partial [Enterocloster sp.]|nr:inositol monophosphatase family protein [Enterocloster sp.]